MVMKVCDIASSGSILCCCGREWRDEKCEVVPDEGDMVDGVALPLPPGRTRARGMYAGCVGMALAISIRGVKPDLVV